MVARAPVSKQTELLQLPALFERRCDGSQHVGPKDLDITIATHQSDCLMR